MTQRQLEAANSTGQPVGTGKLCPPKIIYSIA
jgi:hypothetical protein